ncbi:MAG: glycerol-3-phosphate acyltransferase [Actinobacteria bacterium]|nr:glycerol-3-phosphate acyltransferase [Actinomycetota bacterium]
MNFISLSIIVALASYLVGAIPFSYFVAKYAANKELTKVGSGNIGAMNVRRATGSWAWFTVAMVLDGLKGLVPVILAGIIATRLGYDPRTLKAVALNFSVIGHNFSIFAWILTGKILSGKGLATGGGGLLGYEPMYLVFALLVGLPVIFLTKYLIAGQIAAPLLLPIYVYFVRKEDFLPILILCIVVLIRHLERLPDFLKGKEPKYFINDRKND